jgi:dTDP-4-dehydrorhamnose reductase
MMKIAVTGPKGRLGSALVRAGATPIYADIRDLEQLEIEIQGLRPDVIINCAVKSNVNWCEDNPKISLAVNYRGAVNVRKAFQGWMIQISTDWIFDGLNGPYKEEDHPNPLNAYGWSKWGAEIMLGAYGDLPHTIVRVTNLYDSFSDNFVMQVIRNLCRGEPFLVIPDMYSNPTHINHLVNALQDFITRKLDYIHTINISGTTRCSRLEFAKKVAQTKTSDPEYLKLIQPGFPPGLYEKAKYPKQAGFDLSLAKKLLIPLYSLDEGLEAFNAA